MTYFAVLGYLIGPWLILLIVLTLWDLRRGQTLPPQFHTWSPWAILGGHVAAALIYTTPWDNYLVANRIWWYDPNLVTGITLGWVPIEEYTFFIVQTLLVGLWVLFLLRRQPWSSKTFQSNNALRWGAGVVLGLIWAIWLAVLLSGWPQGKYMAILLVWALPPIILQVGMGADILWRYRRPVLWGLLPPFLYLCLIDGTAIFGGTWTINPANTLGLDLFGVLPLEEITFFLVTCVVITFGITLMLARESHVRVGLIKLP